MPRLFDDESSRDYFSEKYAKEQTATARSVERAVLGHEVGLSGYTTVDEAQLLCSRIEVKPGSRVLDLGSGRGWPGAFLARCMSCRIVFSDLALGALAEALTRLGPDISASAVVADGRASPFRSEVLGAIVHADVF